MILRSSCPGAGQSVYNSSLYDFFLCVLCFLNSINSNMLLSASLGFISTMLIQTTDPTIDESLLSNITIYSLYDAPVRHHPL